ncbi:MAG: cardiolipin synthase [Lachnospiraceae bacterium]|nr:cardiolipin synthase [Lachnospiraceae bacterium]
MRLLKDLNYKKAITNRIVVTVIMVILEFILLLFLFWQVLRFSALILFFFYLLSSIYVIYLVSSKGDPAFRIGWIIVILILPPVGSLLYLLWGDKRPAKRLSSRINAQDQRIFPYLKTDSETVQALQREGTREAKTLHYIQNISAYPAYQNVKTTYYPSGESVYEAMLEDLRSAQEYIFLETFILHEGEMWGTILEILVEKAKAGVDVRIMYDDMGSVSLLPSNYYQDVEALDPRIKCVSFNRVVPFLAMVMNNRDHRKIMIVDGKVGYTGGVNLSDEYINKKVRFGHWKDSGIRLEGAAVDNLTAMFLELWNVSGSEQLNPAQYLGKQHEAFAEDGYVLPYGDSPLDDVRVGEDAYLEVINCSTDYLYIMTPYLIPSVEVGNALCRAAKRGVDVRIATPGIPDKKAVFRLTRANYRSFMNAGVKIYEYTPGFLHCKSFVSDDRTAVVGTINVDYRSLYLHFECGVWMYQCQSLFDVKADTLDVMEKGHLVQPDELTHTWLGRLLDGLLNVMAPLL